MFSLPVAQGRTSYLPSLLTSFLPGSRIDWARQAGRLSDNSVVSPGVNWIWRNLQYPRLIVQQRTKEMAWEELLDHPLCTAIDDGPFLDGPSMWHAILIPLICNGNAYLIKARSSAGAVVGYLPIQPEYVQVVTGVDATRLVDGYIVSIAEGGNQQFVPVAEMVHFRYGVNPNHIALGISPLFAALKEIAGENEAGTITTALIKNAGLLGLTLSPKGEIVEDITPEKRTELEEKFRRYTTGDNAGAPFIMPFPIDVTSIGYSPDKVALPQSRALMASRICAGIGIDPMVIGLPSEQKTYSNYKEAVEAAYENTLLPIMWMIAKQLTRQSLRTDFANTSAQRVSWDTSEVRALQPDLDALHKRLDGSFAAGWLKRKDVRAVAGFPVDDIADDVYSTDAIAGRTGEAKQLWRDAKERALARTVLGDNDDDSETNAQAE